MAKRFTFRFDTMLKIRQQREDEQKRVVAARLRQIAQVRDRIAAIERQIAEETDVVRTGQDTGRIDIQKLMRHRHWIGQLHKNGLEADSRLRYLEAELARERAALAEAMKQRRVLAKLKERQYERHRLEEQRRETRESDELTTVRFVFDRRGEAETLSV